MTGTIRHDWPWATVCAVRSTHWPNNTVPRLALGTFLRPEFPRETRGCLDLLVRLAGARSGRPLYSGMTTCKAEKHEQSIYAPSRHDPLWSSGPGSLWWDGEFFGSACCVLQPLHLCPSKHEPR